MGLLIIGVKKVGSNLVYSLLEPNGKVVDIVDLFLVDCMKTENIVVDNAIVNNAGKIKGTQGSFEKAINKFGITVLKKLNHGNVTIGAQVVDSLGKVSNIKLGDLYDILKNDNVCMINAYMPSPNRIIGIEHTIPVLELGVTVLEKLNYNGVTIGVKIINNSGKVVNIKSDKLYSMVKDCNIYLINATMDSPNSITGIEQEIPILELGTLKENTEADKPANTAEMLKEKFKDTPIKKEVSIIIGYGDWSSFGYSANELGLVLTVNRLYLNIIPLNQPTYKSIAELVKAYKEYVNNYNIFRLDYEMNGTSIQISVERRGKSTKNELSSIFDQFIAKMVQDGIDVTVQASFIDDTNGWCDDEETLSEMEYLYTQLCGNSDNVSMDDIMDAFANTILHFDKTFDDVCFRLSSQVKAKFIHGKNFIADTPWPIDCNAKLIFKNLWKYVIYEKR